jgi:hypothetical protein
MAASLSGREFRFGEAQAVRGVPRRGLDELIEELDGLRVVPGFFQQRSGGIEILERITDSHDQAMQQIKGSGCIARREANLGQTKEVGGNEL